jgi:hypothetical protein
MTFYFGPGDADTTSYFLALRFSPRGEKPMYTAS